MGFPNGGEWVWNGKGTWWHDGELQRTTPGHHHISCLVAKGRIWYRSSFWIVFDAIAFGSPTRGLMLMADRMKWAQIVNQIRITCGLADVFRVTLVSIVRCLWCLYKSAILTNVYLFGVAVERAMRQWAICVNDVKHFHIISRVRAKCIYGIRNRFLGNLLLSYIELLSVIIIEAHHSEYWHCTETNRIAHHLFTGNCQNLTIIYM